MGCTPSRIIKVREEWPNPRAPSLKSANHPHHITWRTSPMSRGETPHTPPPPPPTATKRIQGELPLWALRGDGKRPLSPPLRAGPGLELLVSVLLGGGSSKSTPLQAGSLEMPWALTLARSSQTSSTECIAQKRTIASGCTPVGVMQLSESQDRGRLRNNKNVLEPEPWGHCGRIRTGNQ